MKGNLRHLGYWTGVSLCNDQMFAMATTFQVIYSSKSSHLCGKCLLLKRNTLHPVIGTTMHTSSSFRLNNYRAKTINNNIIIRPSAIIIKASTIHKKSKRPTELLWALISCDLCLVIYILEEIVVWWQIILYIRGFIPFHHCVPDRTIIIIKRSTKKLIKKYNNTWMTF